MPTVQSQIICAALTLDAIQVGGDECLSLDLVGGDALVFGLLGARHVAGSPPILQVVAAARRGQAGERRVIRMRRGGHV